VIRIISQTFICLLFLSVHVFAQTPNIQEGEQLYLEKLYKHLHAHPELSFLETNTAKKMFAELNSIGFEVHDSIGGNGVVGVFKNGKGPTILLRADMDGLPVMEETGLDYASKVRMTDITGEEVPVMHACGHDIHMTVWVGTARNLVAQKEHWKGTLLFIAQPAEERSGGASAMLSDGLYERFGIPDYALALHANAGMPAGKVGWCPGYALANVDMMQIRIKGKGGHGAYPHTTKDPVTLAARIILDLQTIVSREISPLDPAVVTVGSIHGGTKGNVIPNEVVLELTLRSYTDEVREKILSSIEEKCYAAAQSIDLPKELYPEIILHNEFTPALYNDPKLSKDLAKAMSSVIGENNVTEVPPVMGGEDFGMYGRTAENVPIMLFWLGAVSEELYESAKSTGETLPSLHSSKFAPAYEKTIRTGVEAMTACVLRLAGT
jgi:hippurate hydrolase